MALPFVQEFKLGGREGDGVHPYVNERGAFLGRGTPLLERDAIGRWRPRSRNVLERIVSRGYGTTVDLEWRMECLAVVARALNKSDRSLAAIALVHASFPALPETDSWRRMAIIDPLSKFNPDWEDEPRIPGGNPGGGQWTSETFDEDPKATTSREKDSTPKNGEANFTEIAYQGQYHDVVVGEVADLLRSKGLPVEINVPLTTIDGRSTAVADVITQAPDGTLVVILPDRGDRYLSVMQFRSICAKCPP